MTTDRDIVPLVRSWLHDEPDESAEHVLDRALAVIDATSQRPAARWPARSMNMNLIVRLGVAAAVLVMAAVIGYSIYQNVGDSSPAPVVTPGPGEEEPGDTGVPAELEYRFIGDPARVEGFEVDDRLLMDLRSRVMAIVTDVSQSTKLVSAASATDGRVRFETVADGTGCEAGDVGSYPYTLSPGGTVLTVSPGSDDCARRAAAVVGEWHRSACRDQNIPCLGVLEAGRRNSLLFDPFAAPAQTMNPPARYGALSYEVPDGWANADDRTHFYTLMRADEYEQLEAFDCLDCPDGVWIGASPVAAALDCSEERAAGVGTSAQALADWLRAHPGLEVTEGPSTSVDGRPTIVLDIAGSETWADACIDAAHDVAVVHLFTQVGYDFGIRAGDRHRLYLVEIDSDTAMLIAIDSFDAGDLDRVVAETQPIIESIVLAGP